MANVLCTGVDRALMETRAMILRHAGHTVTTAQGELELKAACEQQKFSVAVIGQAITAKEKARVLSLVRQHCPEAKVLELFSPHEGRLLKNADDWLEVPAEIPLELAERVTKLVE